MAGRIRTGMAGWVFPAWRGGQFYPKGLKHKDELAWASRQVTAIEINASFYKLQTPQLFAEWAAATPDDFVFTVKGAQTVTHLKKLKDVEVPVANFLASGVLALGPRLGPICWQLPGNLHYNAERIAAFLELLPKTPSAAQALAKRHDARVVSPYLETTGVTAIRHALEVRHESYATPEFLAQLRAHNVALVVSDTADWPHMDQTADFTYCRLQGPPGGTSYAAEELDGWAARLQALASGKRAALARLEDKQETLAPRDVFAFFVATDKENAPANARAVATRLGITPGT